MKRPAFFNLRFKHFKSSSVKCNERREAWKWWSVLLFWFGDGGGAVAPVKHGSISSRRWRCFTLDSDGNESGGNVDQICQHIKVHTPATGYKIQWTIDQSWSDKSITRWSEAENKLLIKSVYSFTKVSLTSDVGFEVIFVLFSIRQI